MTTIKTEQEWIEAARVVQFEDYQGYLCTYGEEYFKDLAAVDSHFDERPEWLWGCYRTILNFDAQSIVENELCNHHEDAGSWLKREDVAELQELLDAWCEKQKVETWWLDRTVRVMLPKANEVKP